MDESLRGDGRHQPVACLAAKTFVLTRPADDWPTGRHIVMLWPVYPDEMVGEGSGGDSQPTMLEFEVLAG